MLNLWDVIKIWIYGVSSFDLFSGHSVSLLDLAVSLQHPLNHNSENK